MTRHVVATTIATLTLAAALAACNDSGSIKSTPDKDATTPAATASAPTTSAVKPSPTEAAPTKAAPAKIGDTITLHGMDKGSQIAVTLVKWVDPAKGADEYTTPESGKRFVAAQVRIVNTGTGVYDDSPSNGVQIADTEGQRFSSDLNDVSATRP